MKNEIRLDAVNFRNQIKSLALMKGMSLTKLKKIINEKFNKTDSVDNFTKKLRNSTLRVDEYFEIIDALGWEIVLREK